MLKTKFQKSFERPKKPYSTRNAVAAKPLGNALPPQSLTQINNGLSYLVGRFDGFSVGLVVSLGNNQVD